MEAGYRFTTVQRLIRLALLMPVLLQIGPDLYQVLIELWAFLAYRFPLSNQFLPILLWSALKIIVFVSIYLTFIYWFAQFILPVTHARDREKAMWQLLLFGISRGRWHGAAVFIQEGDVVNRSQTELEKSGRGIAFVDLRSAIMLDKHLKQKYDLSPAGREQPQKVHFDPKS
jgi:hypothetical protein